MSSAEFSEWKAFYQVEPFGWQASFYPSANVAAMIGNTHGGKDGKGGEAFKPSDFLPREPEVQSADQMKQFASMLTIALGGEVKTGGEDV